MDTDEVLKMAAQAAARYKARCWWADVDDMTQEAAEAILRARRTHDPRVGVPVGAYCWRAAMLTLRRWAWKASAPVSASAHKLTELRGLHRAAVPEDLPALGRPDQLVGEARRRERIWRIARQVAGDDDEHTAQYVFMDHERPRGLDPTAVARVRRKLLASADLYDLWKEEP